MTPQDHLTTARLLLDRAHHDLTPGGNQMIAAELLWGAFAHCLISAALTATQPHDSHGSLVNIARHLDSTHTTNKWCSSFGAAERLHHHFYHGSLTGEQFRTHTRDITTATSDLLSIL